MHPVKYNRNLSTENMGGTTLFFEPGNQPIVFNKKERKKEKSKFLARFQVKYD